MKLLLLILTTLLCTLTASAQRTIDNPTTEFGTNYGDGFFNLVLDVTKVELKKTETVVYITALERSDISEQRFQFVGDTYLKVGEKRYPLVSADGIPLNQFVNTTDGKRDMAFHFQPIPMDTKSFDFIEGDGQGAFQIKGIKSEEERWQQMMPSYWRDQSGDWQLAFCEDFAIYQCKFWDYKQRDINSKNGTATFVLTNGSDELKITVGKDQKGSRTMNINGKNVVYTMITSRFLPDYPTKDTRTDFVDNGYKIDTITVVGWLKDMPDYYKQLKTFDFGYNDIFADDQASVNADLDEKGRFSVKIPVANSTEFFCDWRRCFVRMMLEPGKTYFMLYDYKEGRRYFMGDDCRLQNELFKYPLDWNDVRMEEGGDFDAFIASSDSLIKARYQYIDGLCDSHPTLSTRFRQYRKGNTLWQQAKNVGQARFNNRPDYRLPENARKYAYDNFWTQLPKPYTLHRDLSGFMRDFIDDGNRQRLSYNYIDHIDEIADNADELALLTRWEKWVTEAQATVDAATTDEEKKRLAEEVNAKNADLIKEVEKILMRPSTRGKVNEYFFNERLKSLSFCLDSLNVEPIIRDIWLAQVFFKEIDQRRTSLPPSMIEKLKSIVKNPICINMVEKRNNHYIAIENGEIDKAVFKSADNLQGISEGKDLLDKILEPYKGKIVLLDVWGTWCGPCKMALSKSAEEYERLKDFDIQYLYLANNSPMDSWENVIKEYNVTGDNVAHFNLPDDQQAAIERYLNVQSFPTYKLFDREGRLLDLKVNARDLDGLVRLLEKL